MATMWVTIVSALGASSTVFGAIYGAWSQPIQELIKLRKTLVTWTEKKIQIQVFENS